MSKAEREMAFYLFIIGFFCLLVLGAAAGFLAWALT